MTTLKQVTHLPEHNYSVIASWKYKNDDPVSFCNAVKEFVEKGAFEPCSKPQAYIRWFLRFNHITFSTPFECFKFICPNGYLDGEFIRANFSTSDYIYYCYDYYYDEWMHDYCSCRERMSVK